MLLGSCHKYAVKALPSKSVKLSNSTFEVGHFSRKCRVFLRELSQEKTEMAWYAYCITEHPGLQNGIRPRRPFILENLKGVNDAAVFAYPSGEFAVIVSEYSTAAPLNQQAIVEHARVISDCFRSMTVLPFRFGTIFDSDEALRRAVRTNRKTFLESVAKLRGKAEMHFKIVLKDAAVEQALRELPVGVGGEYLRKLREQASRERERQNPDRQNRPHDVHHSHLNVLLRRFVPS